MTKAATLLQEHLKQRWPDLTFEGYNCRPIAGTRQWSQHSWPGSNAQDIFGSTARLDQVAAYLRVNKVRFGIKTILWRVKDHYDHVHADMWPTGYGTPPCGRGRERYQYSDGKIVSASGGNVAPQGTFGSVVVPIPEDEMTLTDARIDVASAWYAKSGEWMSPSSSGEGRSARLSRLAADVLAGRRTVASIVEFAVYVKTPDPAASPPAWVFTSALWVD